MRLIVQYTSGPGFPFLDTEIIVSLVYKSREAFLMAFEEKARGVKKEYLDNDQNFVLAGEIFEYSDFVVNGKYYAPEVMTLDE